MKCIIAGGRDYTLTSADLFKLDEIDKEIGITEVVSGGAKGVDTDGELWAVANMKPFKRFKADWVKYGKATGPIRNAQMADYADVCILFHGGRGTKNMHKTAKDKGLKVIEMGQIRII